MCFITCIFAKRNLPKKCKTLKFLFAPDWVLKTDQDLDGIPLSYIDMLERSESEERRRDREVQIMQEGK